MDAFERTLAKSQQLAYIETVAAVLAQNESRDLPIDPSIVVEYEDIKKYLTSISRSKARFAVFDRGSCFTIVRLVDNFDLRSVYGEPGKKPTTPAKTGIVVKIQQPAPIDQKAKLDQLSHIEQFILPLLFRPMMKEVMRIDADSVLTEKDIRDRLTELSTGAARYVAYKCKENFVFVRALDDADIEQWYRDLERCGGGESMEIEPRTTQAPVPDDQDDDQSAPVQTQTRPLTWIEQQESNGWE